MRRCGAVLGAISESLSIFKKNNIKLICAVVTVIGYASSPKSSSNYSRIWCTSCDIVLLLVWKLSEVLSFVQIWVWITWSTVIGMTDPLHDTIWPTVCSTEMYTSPMPHLSEKFFMSKQVEFELQNALIYYCMLSERTNSKDVHVSVHLSSCSFFAPSLYSRAPRRHVFFVSRWIRTFSFSSYPRFFHCLGMSSDDIIWNFLSVLSCNPVVWISPSPSLQEFADKWVVGEVYTLVKYTVDQLNAIRRNIRYKPQFINGNGKR